MPHKNVLLRMQQYQSAENSVRCLELAKNWISAKIENCRTLLMRNHIDPPKEITNTMSRLAKSVSQVDNLESLLGFEGLAAKNYFSAFNGMLKMGKQKENTSPWNFDFNGRNRRPALDPINALLSYAYSLLAKDVSITLLLIGFDPFLGFFHQPRYGRPALALDLMEEFRPIIADSVVLWSINNGVLSPMYFIQRGPSVALKPEARKRFIQAYEKRMETLITHPIFGYQISYRRVLEVQARLLARVLTGEIDAYPPFKTR